jgi:hypothetical protein
MKTDESGTAAHNAIVVCECTHEAHGGHGLRCPNKIQKPEKLCDDCKVGNHKPVFQ